MTVETAQFQPKFPEAVLAGLLGLIFALGGSQRGDIAFAAITQTAAALCLGLAMATLQVRHLRGYGLPVTLALAALLLPALQLVPLPPELWQRLPGRVLIVEIDRAAGLGAISRPLTMTPPETVSAFRAGLVPLAVLLLGVQLRPKQLVRVLLLTLSFGAISALMGLLQLLGDPAGSLYLYASTNNGSAVGLFANRNHQAVTLACLVPLAFAAARLGASDQAAAFGQTERHSHAARYGQPHKKIEWRVPLAIAATCILVPLVLVTGSRSGLMMTALALVSLPFVIRQRYSRKSNSRISTSSWLAITASIVVTLAAIAIWLGRDLALDRLFASSPVDDLRLQMLPTILELVRTHWIWGTGIGSFERLYQVNEPARLLLPQYVNHAHNDWLEIIVTGGLPAAVLLAAGLLGIARRGYQIAREPTGDVLQPLHRAALVCVLILSLASFSDYPLRTPYLAAFLALCAVWLFAPTSFAARGVGASVNSPLRV